MTSGPQCAVGSCGRPVYVRGWCTTHYQRWRRHGDPAFLVNPVLHDRPEIRFWAKVRQTPTGCWLWTGRSFTEFGYALLKVDEAYRVAHRWMYEQVRGPVPAGLVLDHFVCNTPPCVNPWHVRPVSQRENLLRGNTLQSINAAKTECVNGHPFDDANTRIHIRGTRAIRVCRACARVREARRRHRRSAA